MSELKIARPNIEKVSRTPVVFENEESGLKLAGIIYKPRTMKEGDKLPAVVIGGPMLSVKELVQSLYAQLLAERGYITMVYDNSYIGSSEGNPRGLEDPEIKGSDIRSAVTYLAAQPYVNANRIAGIGVCGSGVYLPNGVRNDARVKAVVSIVPFTIMNTIVTATDEELLKQKKAYENGEEPARLDLVSGSELVDYYFNTDRGAAANMVNPVSWSQLAWHQFNPIETVKELKAPYLVITAENAFTRQGAEQMFANANEPKELYVVKGAKHSDLYDVEPCVTEALEQIEKFFAKHL
ncbi:MAG: alpha/beta hydrolase [Schwartzia sp.]|nr:alpha/beta hydrolase [Schwartzia sp. (in: firmicutes)]